MNKIKFIESVQPYTMTSINCIEHLYDSLENIRINNIPGDFAECGVWKGGNIIGIIEYLNYYSMTDKHVWLYDTFVGMTKPSDIDYTNNSDQMSSSDTLNYWKDNNKNNVNQWCYCSLQEVKNNLSTSKFPVSNIHYIVGDVCKTLQIESNLPKSLCLLRLDTDWYDSTKIELEKLYPRLEKNGTLIIDDYHYWHGSKKETDEFFNNDTRDFVTLNKKSTIFKIK